jgi:hypothetical protein
VCDYPAVKSKPAERPQPHAWNRDIFGGLCGLALILSGVTYDHSAFEVRAGGIWLATIVASCMVSFASYKRRLREWHDTADCEPVE